MKKRYRSDRGGLARYEIGRELTQFNTVLTHSAPAWPFGRKLGWCDRLVKGRIARRVLNDGRHLGLCTSCVSSRKRSTRRLGGSCLFSIIAKAKAPRKLGSRTMGRGETGEATEVSEVRFESSGEPGEKGRRLGSLEKTHARFREPAEVTWLPVKHQVSGQVKPNPKVGFTRTG